MTDGRHRIDLAWLWGSENRQLDGVATLLATVIDPRPGIAAQRVDDWLCAIEHGEGDARWSGGWRVEVRSRSGSSVVLALVAGGQDVADALEDATDRLQDAVLRDSTTIEWEQLPIEAGADAGTDAGLP